ncbi:MAG: peroxidase [Gammaproteobacteria bacterium]|nr:MAG: peroxidase [Gammaproteobacteria bacterium]
MPLLPQLSAQATVLDVFELSPEFTPPLMEYHQLLLRGPSSFSVAERELIAAYVSGLNACGFCHGAHTAVAASFGISQNQLDQMMQNLDESGIDEKIIPVLRYVEKLTRLPSKLTQADADAVYAAGWDEEALNHAIHVCALFNFMNRLVEGHGISPMPAQANQQMAQMLHDKGYEGL